MDELEIFEKASEIEDPDDRNAYLDKACHGDRSLRQRFDALLQFHCDNNSFLNDPLVDLTHAWQDDLAEGLGSTIGPYKLLEKIGEGGMGVVYMAEQREPVHRRVALKIIKLGMDTRQVIGRFEAERQALAMMDHLNIAKIFDGGTTEAGRPYFVMELVKGFPITEFCDVNRMDIRERLNLFRQVCSAVQHAHQKGIIHRDLKPSNIMVAIHDDRPVPKVIDFGVAKAMQQRLTEKTVFTLFQQIIGTPAYMSPEQASFSDLDVDIRSDIYSLGVLLYELLTGATPLDLTTARAHVYDEICQIIRDDEPAPPSVQLVRSGPELAQLSRNRNSDIATLPRAIRGDLDWIVMKALEKDRARRYETAAALSHDVDNYLNHRPVSAGRPTAIYRIAKLIRRNRAATALIGVVTVSAVALLIVGTWRHSTLRKSYADIRQKSEVIRQELNEARTSRDRARYDLYLSHILRAHQSWVSGRPDTAFSVLDSHRPTENVSDLRGWEWYYLKSLVNNNETLFQHENSSVLSCAWSDDGRYLASGASNGTIVVCDVDLKKRHRLHNGQQPITAIAWHADGEQLAAVAENGVMTVYDLLDWKPLHVESSGRDCISWNSHQDIIATANEENVLICDLSHVPAETRALPDAMWFASWSSDGRYLATGSGGDDRGRVAIWDMATDRRLIELSPENRHVNHITSIAWNHDDSRLAFGISSEGNGYVSVWETKTWDEQEQMLAHRGSKCLIAWNRDGGRLATAGDTGLVRIWDSSTWQESMMLYADSGAVSSISCRANQPEIATGYSDGALKIWNCENGTAKAMLTGAGKIAWSPDGQQIAANGNDNDNEPRTIRFFDADDLRELRVLGTHEQGWLSSLAWSPSGNRFAASVAGPNGALIIWELSSGEELLHINSVEVLGLSWNPESRLVACGCADGVVRVWDIDQKKLIQQLTADESVIGSVAWNQSGSQLACSSYDQVVKVWNAGTWTQREFQSRRSGRDRSGDGQFSLAFAPNDQLIVHGGSQGLIRIWDVASGQHVNSFKGNSTDIWSVAWHPDGTRLATGGEDRTVRIWDTATWQEVLMLEEENAVSALSWSPNGRKLAAACGPQYRIRIWDATVGYAAFGIE